MSRDSQDPPQSQSVVRATVLLAAFKSSVSFLILPSILDTASDPSASRSTLPLPNDPALPVPVMAS